MIYTRSLAADVGLKRRIWGYSKTGFSTATVDYQVNSNTDDCYVIPYSIISLYDYPLVFGVGANSNNHYSTGIRFASVIIPNEATITAAYLTFVSAGNDSGTTCNANIYGENANNPATYSTYTDFAGRELTSAVSWSGVGVWSLDSSYNSPDISTILQTIVDRAGWVSGNAMAFYIKDNSSSTSAFREPYSIEENAGKAAKLHVEYSGIITKSYYYRSLDQSNKEGLLSFKVSRVQYKRNSFLRQMD
jgi:hypothetical protein